jgi:hypothetical protein
MTVDSLVPVGADVDPEKSDGPANGTPAWATIENKNCPVLTVIGVVLIELFPVPATKPVVKLDANQAAPDDARKPTPVVYVTTMFFAPLAAGTFALKKYPISEVLLTKSWVREIFAPVGS